MTIKARPLTEDERIEIYRKYRDGRTAPSLTREYRCSLHQVYDIAKKYGGKYQHNQEVEISERQHQILLGGWLGDGYFKLNGNTNVCYVECHAEGEYEYLQWKFEELGLLTQDTKIYTKNDNNEHSSAREFTTKTTPSLIKYRSYTRSEVIQNLDELGLIIHLLDDGWLRITTEHLRKGNYNLTVYTWSPEERQLLIDQWYNIMGVVFKERGIKRVNLAATNSESQKIYEIAKKYIPMNLDICQKKFRIFNL